VSLDENLNRVLARHEELSSLMSSGKQPSAEEFVRMSREYSELTPVVEGILALRDAEMELDDVLSMMNDPDVDAEMQEMAEKEHRELQGRLPDLARAVQICWSLRMKLIQKMRFSNCVQELVGMKPLCLQLICFACINAMPKTINGNLRL
jgi:protein subunit release factor A